MGWKTEAPPPTTRAGRSVCPFCISTRLSEYNTPQNHHIQKDMGMPIIKILSGLALTVSLIWVIAKPDYDSVSAVIAALIALIALYIREQSKQQPLQHQIVAKNGVGIQAGGNINVGSVRTTRKDKDAE
jgi:hypothetical protein